MIAYCDIVNISLIDNLFWNGVYFIY